MAAFNGIFTAFFGCYPTNESIKQQLNVEATTLEGRGSPWTVIDPSFNSTEDRTNWISDNAPNQSLAVTFYNL